MPGQTLELVSYSNLPPREVKTEIEQMTRPELRFLKSIPESLFLKLRRTVGWNVIITAQK